MDSPPLKRTLKHSPTVVAYDRWRSVVGASTRKQRWAGPSNAPNLHLLPSSRSMVFSKTHSHYPTTRTSTLQSLVTIIG